MLKNNINISLEQLKAKVQWPMISQLFIVEKMDTLLDEMI
jgi:hypothetical protein